MRYFTSPLTIFITIFFLVYTVSYTYQSPKPLIGSSSNPEKGNDKPEYTVSDTYPTHTPLVGSSSSVDQGNDEPEYFTFIKTNFYNLPETERTKLVKDTKAIYKIEIKSQDNKDRQFIVDLQNGSGELYMGEVKTGESLVQFSMSEMDFRKMMTGELYGYT